jgi:hypothetical protein
LAFDVNATFVLVFPILAIDSTDRELHCFVPRIPDKPLSNDIVASNYRLLKMFLIKPAPT